MKSIIKNFISVMRRYNAAAALNALGLTAAFAAFAIIMTQVHYERTFDGSHPNAQRIFRVDLERKGGDRAFILSRALVDALIASSPHIEAGTLLTPINHWWGDFYLTVGDSSHMRGFREPFITCYPDITRIFGFDFIEGDPDCLRDPGTVVIPQSMAQRLFGDAPATGEEIRCHDVIFTTGASRFTVGGVYRDFPGNTQMENVVYTAIDRTMEGNWTANNFICYLLLDDGANAPELEAYINSSFDFSALWDPASVEGIRLLSLTGLYYDRAYRSGSADSTRILFLIALLIVAIAAINFTNFSIALAPIRMRNLNTRRILGSSAGGLRCALLGEACAVAFLSWLLSLLVVHELGAHGWLPFIEADVNPLHNAALTAATAGVALAVGLAAGLYPAFYMTSFQPALVLKGSFALSPRGRALRTALIAFQYIASICLIIVALFMQMQNRYMRTFDQGFDHERIAIVELNAAMYDNSREAYVNSLKSYPGIEDVAFSKQKAGASDQYSTYGFKHLGREANCFTMEVSQNFLRVMGIPVVAGRDFTAADELTSGVQTVIANSTMQQFMEIEAGETIEMTGWRKTMLMAGVTGEVKMTSMRRDADRIIFLANSPDALAVSYIRLRPGANVVEAVDHIRRSVAAIDPTFPVDVEFYDQVFDRLYRRETALGNSITLLALLAAIISLAGVFGLVLFETQCRRREIGIRKVFGSTTLEILMLFNRTYLRIVCICFALAAPLAWYGVTRWLESFAYRTPLHWWVFALAFLAVAAVTFATVTVQNLRAARTNPVESIKIE
jgi:putative ABC transport system permease protein